MTVRRTGMDFFRPLIERVPPPHHRCVRL